MPSEALARVRGLPNIPSIVEVNVRNDPSTANDVAFKVPVGMSGQRILDVAPDGEGKSQDGKRYEWFKLSFDGGAVGWIRDDLLEIEGDCTAFGYPALNELTWAFSLTRNTEQTPAPTTETTTTPPTTEVETTTTTSPTPETSTPAQPKQMGTVWQVPGETTEPVMIPTLASGDFPDAYTDTDRVRTVAFLFTSSWEGGFGAINTYDSGIVSYGFLQFTLAGGSLISVLQKFIATSESDAANTIEGMMGRIQAKDSLLRTDQTFLGALRAAASEQAMIDAQYAVGTDGYWKKVVDGYITHRHLKYPLTWALLFDMGVNFGVNHGFVRLAEEDLGVPSRSNPAETGVGEEQLMTYVAQLRKRSHDRQARQANLPGLAKRGDFWMKLCTDGDWYLQGGASGTVVSNGRPINVKHP
ncbi:MAG: hypothetical protein AAFV98_16115 [Chloroflexota bacterium]